jgi:hypothetical protein
MIHNIYNSTAYLSYVVGFGVSLFIDFLIQFTANSFKKPIESCIRANLDASGYKLIGNWLYALIYTKLE